MESTPSESSDSTFTGLSDSAIHAALDEFFDQIEEPDPVEQQIRQALQAIRDEYPDATKRTTAQRTFEGMVAELRRATQDTVIEVILDAVELLDDDKRTDEYLPNDTEKKRIPDFAPYAKLLRRYADHRKKDPQFMAVPELVDDDYEAYLVYCSQNPYDVEGQRRLYEQLCDRFDIGTDWRTWVADVGMEVISVLAAEGRRLKQLEQEVKEMQKKERATDRLKRRHAPAALEMKQRIDEIDNPLILNGLIKAEKDFGAFEVNDRDFLVTHAFDRLQRLLVVNADELEVHFKREFSYLAGLRDTKELAVALERSRQGLEEACERNHFFKDRYSERWFLRLERLSARIVSQESSCIRTGIATLLIAGAGVIAGMTFDQWKQRFGFYPLNPKQQQAPVNPGDGVAPTDSRTEDAPNQETNR